MMSSWTFSRPCGTFTENRPWASGWAWAIQNEPSIRPKTKLPQPALGCPLLSTQCPSITTEGEARISSGSGVSPSLIVSFVGAKTPGNGRRVQPDLPVAIEVGRRWA